MIIRKSTYDDIPCLMEIYREARQIHLDSGNLHQWKEGYPSVEIVRNDIDSGNGYCIEDDGKIAGAFAFIPGEDPTYKEIEGAWTNATMRHCIEKAGFRYCGVIHLQSGEPRLAYQKVNLRPSYCVSIG